MTGIRRAAVLVSASSILVPMVGLATAPILTHSLGAGGRGTSAAAAAPFFVASTAASLGLPQALTYFVAQGRRITAGVMWSIGAVATVVGVVTMGSIYLAGDYLSAGDRVVEDLILLGSVFVVPALLVGLLRGVAVGLQMWHAVAADRALQTLAKALALVGLAVSGKLDVLSAVLVLCLSPVAGVVAYHRILRGQVRPVALDDATPLRASSVLRYGTSVWVGSIALMLMARVNEMFVLPLSDAQQLGLLVVAVTVSDIPWIVTQALKDVLFGASSRTMDRDLLARASRITTAGALLLGAAIGVTAPLWLGLVFGAEFSASFWPTVVLLASAAVAVPGLVTGAGLEAAGRPQARSATLVASLVVNVVLVFLLAPALGAIGAALAILGSTVFSTAVTSVVARRILRVRLRSFVVPERSDLQLIRSQLRGALRAVQQGRWAGTARRGGADGT